MEHLDEEFQTEVIDKNIADSNKQISDNLGSASQSGARKTNMACHPEARQESNRKFEHKGCNVGREGDKTEVKNLAFEDEMVKHIIQYPLQRQIETAASTITKQFKAHHLAERRIEEVYDRGQSAFYPGFYVFEG